MYLLCALPEFFKKIERRLSSASNKCNNCDLGVLEPHVTALQAFQSGDASAISRSVSLPPNGNRPNKVLRLCHSVRLWCYSQSAWFTRRKALSPFLFIWLWWKYSGVAAFRAFSTIAWQLHCGHLTLRSLESDKNSNIYSPRNDDTWKNTCGGHAEGNLEGESSNFPDFNL